VTFKRHAPSSRPCAASNRGGYHGGASSPMSFQLFRDSTAWDLRPGRISNQELPLALRGHQSRFSNPSEALNPKNLQFEPEGARPPPCLQSSTGRNQQGSFSVL